MTADVWWGLLYAVVEAAADRLEIARDDIDGTLHYGGDGPPTLVLFDDVPAGAGHVQRISEDLEGVLEAAYRRVADCECGPETSCYRCLRGFRNQRLHEQLRRGAVADLLDHLLHGDGDEAAGRGKEFEPVTVADLAAFDGREVVAMIDGHETRGTLWVEEADGEVISVLLQSDSEARELQPDTVSVIAMRKV